MRNTDFDISLIIPFYNEEANLSNLIDDIRQQQGIRIQLIMVDGGSSDNSNAIIQQYWESNANDMICCCCVEAHRAKQLNLGATLASADDLLFLHADSRLCAERIQSHLLADALTTLRQMRASTGSGNMAGHFPLLFQDTAGKHPLGFYFYAAKTALNRTDVINGDQGFMLSRAFFKDLAEFDESLPYMEDARLAAKIFAQGTWITLPGYLYTSARRFVAEGFSRRQILNSFLCNFNAMHFDAFFLAARDAYKLQNHTGRLALLPFLQLIHRLMYQGGSWLLLKRWYATGAYVNSNAWQLAFSLDCRRGYRQAVHPHHIETPALAFYDRYLTKFMNSKPINTITAMLTCIWFYSLFIVYRK